MNHILKTMAILIALIFTSYLHAQPSGGIWTGSKTTKGLANSNATAIHKMWKSTWDAYQAGDNKKMWAAYTNDAAEISPDGNITYGKKALKASWEEFMKMADKAPSFTYGDPQVRMLTNDIALIVWDSSADIQMGGKQLGGKTKGMAVVRKIKGQWLIEFDSLTPVIPRPETQK